MEKQQMRRQVFAMRKAADRLRMMEDSRRICAAVAQTRAFRDAACVYAYLDTAGEVCTRPLLEAAWNLGKRVAAPRVVGEGEMVFSYIRSLADLAFGYRGILEPAAGPAAREERALLIVPGVAFDRQCRRCGYGKGFYDRYLAAHPSHPTIALAFSFQIFQEIPAEPHDMRPQMVVTETGAYLRDADDVCRQE